MSEPSRLVIWLSLNVRAAKLLVKPLESPRLRSSALVSTVCPFASASVIVKVPLIPGSAVVPPLWPTGSAIGPADCETPEMAGASLVPVTEMTTFSDTDPPLPSLIVTGVVMVSVSPSARKSRLGEAVQVQVKLPFIFFTTVKASALERAMTRSIGGVPPDHATVVEPSLTVSTSVRSRSLAVKLPLVLMDVAPVTASANVSAKSPPALIVGASLAPVMVIVTVSVSAPPSPSLTSIS